MGRPPQKSRAAQSPPAAAASKAAPGEQAAPPRRPGRRFSLGRFAGLTSELRTAVVNLGILFALAVLVPLLVQQVVRKQVLIEPISVPPALAEAGITPEVAAKRLWDGLGAVTRKANTSRKSIQAVPDSEVISFSIPDSGLSFDSLISYLRAVFNTYPTRIGGEFSCADPECKPEGLTLRLRVMRNDHRVIDLPPRGSDGEDAYIIRAATEVMALVDPFVAIAALADSQPARAEHLARALILSGGPDRQWAHNLVGILLADRGDFKGAEAAYRAALAVAPGFLPARKNLAGILSEEGDLVAARHEFEDLYRAYPRDDFAMLGLGEIALAENRPDEALAWFARAAAAAPLATRPLVRAAEIESGRGGHGPAAEALWQKALDIDPGDAVAVLNYSGFLDASGRKDDALALFARAADTYPDAADWQDQYAERLRQAGKAEAALRRVDAAIMLAPRDAGIRLTRAYVRRDLADPSGALQDAEAAEGLDPNLTSAIFLQGGLLRALGRIEEAVAAYERFAARAPDDPFAAIVPKLVEQLRHLAPPPAENR